MKKFMFLLLSLLPSLAGALLAQSPQSFNYQAILRDAAGQVRAEQNAVMQITLLQGTPAGSAVYTESHNVRTNAFGLVNIAVGAGTGTGNFSSVNWANGPYFIRISVDGTEMGTSQLLSVPYALYASQAGNGFSGSYNDLSNKPDLSEKDPIFAASAANSIANAGSGQVITTAERARLDSAITLKGAAKQGNLISFDGNNWVASDLLTGNTGASQPFSILPPFGVVNYCIALQGIYPSRNGSEPFIAEIMLFGGNFPPRGFAFCDGQLLSIAQNSALFSLLGTTYGGDGRTTFALPDLRGRVPMHAGTGPGLSPVQLGQTGGSQTQTLNITQMPVHNHPVQIKN